MLKKGDEFVFSRESDQSPIIKSSNHQIPKSPNHQITNHRITKSPNHQIIQSTNHQIIKSPNHQITNQPPSPNQIIIFEYTIIYSGYILYLCKKFI